MSAVAQVTKSGPRTYTPVEPILGGQLVEARTGGRVGVAAVSSVKVLGVALTDAQSPDAFTGLTTTGADGRPLLNAAVLPTVVPVAYGGIETKVVFDVAATFGQKLKAAAAGKVTPYGVIVAPATTTTDTPDMLVGVCTSPNGVAAGAVGLVRTL